MKENQRGRFLFVPRSMIKFIRRSIDGLVFLDPPNHCHTAISVTRNICAAFLTAEVLDRKWYLDCTQSTNS